MVFAVADQDPNEIEWFEFTLPGAYAQAVYKSGPKKGELQFEDDGETPIRGRELEVFRLPKMQYLGVDQVAIAEGGGSLSQILELFGNAAGPMRKLNGKQMGQLMAAWRKASAVGLGESEA